MPHHGPIHLTVKRPNRRLSPSPLRRPSRRSGPRRSLYAQEPTSRS